MSGFLVLARHQESEWNEKGLWTGTTDVGLSEEGESDALRLGALVDDVPFSCAFVSEQWRSKDTLRRMLKTAHDEDIPVSVSPALNERDYGDYTGLNKWEVEKQVGEELFHAIRRGWDTPIPRGESLRQVYERALPYFRKEILPHVHAGENVLVVSSGNTLRSIIKYVESVSDEGIADIEMPFEEAILYRLDADGRMVSKEVRHLGASA